MGSDWSTLEPVLIKVHEVIDEVMHDARQPEMGSAMLAEEKGDLPFATVNLSRHLGQTAKVALQQAKRTFVLYFRHIEAVINAQRLTLAQAVWRKWNRFGSSQAPEKDA